jgi:hypothetical protein
MHSYGTNYYNLQELFPKIYLFFCFNNCLFTLSKARPTLCLIPYSSPLATNFPLLVKKFTLHRNKGTSRNLPLRCSNCMFKIPSLTNFSCFSRNLSTHFLTKFLSCPFKVFNLPAKCIDTLFIRVTPDIK